MQVKPYLKEISLKRELIEDFEAYPFCIPGVRKLRARIYLLDEDGVRKVEYEDTEHFSVTRQFLNGYRQLLGILMEP